MARTPRNDLAVRQFADAVADLLKTHPPVTPKDIELFAYAHLDGMRVSEESIRKALRGMVDPSACDVELIVALGAYFEVPPEALGSFAATRVARVLAYATGGPDGGGDLATARSRCTAQQTSVELATVTAMRWHQPRLEEAA